MCSSTESKEPSRTLTFSHHSPHIKYLAIMYTHAHMHNLSHLHLPLFSRGPLLAPAWLRQILVGTVVLLHRAALAQTESSR